MLSNERTAVTLAWSLALSYLVFCFVEALGSCWDRFKLMPRKHMDTIYSSSVP